MALLERVPAIQNRSQSRRADLPVASATPRAPEYLLCAVLVADAAGPPKGLSVGNEPRTWVKRVHEEAFHDQRRPGSTMGSLAPPGSSESPWGHQSVLTGSRRPAYQALARERAEMVLDDDNVAR